MQSYCENLSSIILRPSVRLTEKCKPKISKSPVGLQNWKLLFPVESNFTLRLYVTLPLSVHSNQDKVVSFQPSIWCHRHSSYHWLRTLLSSSLFDRGGNWDAVGLGDLPMAIHIHSDGARLQTANCIFDQAIAVFKQGLGAPTGPQTSTDGPEGQYWDHNTEIWK